MAKFDFHYSVNNDMKEVYRTLYEKYNGYVPEIITYEKLPDNAHIMYSYGEGGMARGNSRLVYMMKDDTSEVILKYICDELDCFYSTANHKCEEAPFTFFPHTMDNGKVGMWLMYACEIADVLKVDLKPITFTHLPFPSGYASDYPTIINQDMEDVEIAACIAHELRHAWQHINYPEWVDDENYIHPEEDEDAYMKQPAEIDAEAFGFKVVNALYGMDILFNLTAHGHYEQIISNLYRERMNDIDLVLSKKKLKMLRELLDIDGQIAQVNDKRVM